MAPGRGGARCVGHPDRIRAWAAASLHAGEGEAILPFFDRIRRADRLSSLMASLAKPTGDHPWSLRRRTREDAGHGLCQGHRLNLVRALLDRGDQIDVMGAQSRRGWRETSLLSPPHGTNCAGGWLATIAFLDTPRSEVSS
jgi:hypothetical protein